MSQPQAGILQRGASFGGAHWIAWSISALLCVGVALVSYRYPLQIGPLAPPILQNLFAKPWLMVHAAAAATALLIAPAQFVPSLRARARRLHRWMGRTYIVACVIGGVSGFMLALGSTAGPIATAGFGILAVLWLITTLAAWRHAVRRDFAAHRAWMIRSFALSFAAVTLRVYMPMLAFLPVDANATYRAISFLCWVPNLIVAELYLRRRAG